MTSSKKPADAKTVERDATGQFANVKLSDVGCPSDEITCHVTVYVPERPSDTSVEAVSPSTLMHPRL